MNNPQPGEPLERGDIVIRSDSPGNDGKWRARIVGDGMLASGIEGVGDTPTGALRDFLVESYWRDNQRRDAERKAERERKREGDRITRAAERSTRRRWWWPS